MCRNPVWPGLSGALAAPSVATWDDLGKVATWPLIGRGLGQQWANFGQPIDVQCVGKVLPIDSERVKANALGQRQPKVGKVLEATLDRQRSIC